jgi:hypothetical protein
MKAVMTPTRPNSSPSARAKKQVVAYGYSPSVSRLALTDRAWFGETDRDLGVIGVGELSMLGMESLVRPS